jgi:hypothetical protein
LLSQLVDCCLIVVVVALTITVAVAVAIAAHCHLCFFVTVPVPLAVTIIVAIMTAAVAVIAAMSPLLSLLLSRWQRHFCSILKGYNLPIPVKRVSAGLGGCPLLLRHIGKG